METLAPWAELVLTTADELLLLPEDEWHYELVEGRLVRMSPTGSDHGEIAAELLLAVGPFIKKLRLGKVYAAETGFHVSPRDRPDTVLAPDLAFVRADRVPDTPIAGFLRLAPDLVAEVASPDQGRTVMAAKARRWLDAGVRLVWIVFPKTRTVEVWRHGEAPRVLTTDDELSGDEVLPEFTYPVRRLFP